MEVVKHAQDHFLRGGREERKKRGLNKNPKKYAREVLGWFLDLGPMVEFYIINGLGW